MKLNPLTAIDFYKADHRRQYPEGTNKVYSNLTARSNRLTNCEADKVVFFGLQYFIKDFLIDTFNKEFFWKHKHEVITKYKRRMDTSLGEGSIPVEHIEALHDLGYLPVQIKALTEGTLVPIKTPMLTITNTHPEFFWLVNYLETILSAYLWKPCTSATTAYQYKKLFVKYAEKTSDELWFTDYQGHDFSFRGMAGYQDAVLSGAAHLLSFKGTDTIPAIDFMEQYYRADAEEALIGCSVPATEHSVMCMGGKETEIETFNRLLDLYPKGILSVVSDTWDFWGVLTSILPQLKDKIMSREGKLVIRPDSGDPVDIICGTGTNYSAMSDRPEVKGAVEVLWDLFGGTINSKGYKQLDSHIGLIYGDSITYSRAKEILAKLEAKGFASTNVVFGIGSFTYEYVTRDTYGFAVKSTYGEINGVPQVIQKDPKTDNGTKKSAKGLIRVNADLSYTDDVTYEEEDKGELRTVFKDGDLQFDQSLEFIRSILGSQYAEV